VKKNITTAFTIFSALLLLGCSAKKQNSEQLYAPAPNEIFTYQKPDNGKTKIVVELLAINEMEPILTAFQKAYPDIQPIVLYMQTTQNSYEPSIDWFKHGYLPDIVFNLRLSEADTVLYQEDLSGISAVSAYAIGSLNDIEKNGKIYSLPGPSKIMAIAYNKNLFKQYGWSIPKTFDQFINLCDKIKKDTRGAVEPYNPDGKYTDDFMAGLEGFAYEQVFGGIKNKGWYDKMLHGDAVLGDTMKPFFTMVQTMIDHGLIRTEHSTYSYTMRSKEFAAGHIAMMNVLTDLIPEEDKEIYGFFPFPGTTGESYLTTRCDYNECLIKRPRTDSEQKAVSEFFDFISTKEAQEILIGGKAQLSSVKGVATVIPHDDDMILSAISDGRYFNRIDFKGGVIPNTFNFLAVIREAIFSMAQGKLDSIEALSFCDSQLLAAEHAATSPSSEEQVCVAKKTFTMLETTEYIADKFRAATNADIAIVPHNSYFCGNISRIFEGPVTRSMIDTCKPRSFASDAHLVKAHMTGSQLKAALNDAPALYDETANCIYAASGMKIKVAPWNEQGKRYLSLALANGKSIEENAIYTVSFWQGMVKEKYISDIVGTYDSSYIEFMVNAMRNDKTISPCVDDRMTLIWN